VVSRPSQGRDELDDAGREVAGLAAGGGLNVIGALVSQAGLFGVTLLLARGMGTESVGRFSQAFALRALLSLVCLGGMRSALTRYVAVYRADDDAAGLRGTVRLGLALGTVSSTALALVLFLASPFLAHHAFHDGHLTVLFRLVAVSLPPSVITVAALSATQGFKTMRPFAIVGSIVEPVLRLFLAGVTVALGSGAEGAMVAVTIASFVAAALSLRSLHRLLQQVPAATPRYDHREIRRFARISWASSMANQGLLWADIVVLGVLADSHAVGVYQVATRLVLLAGLAVNALTAAFAPRAAHLWQVRDVPSLGRVYQAANSWTLRSTIPGLAVILVFPRPLLHIFGNGFSGGVAVMFILLVGQLVDSASSSSAVLLNMAGRNGVNMVDSVAALVLNLALNIVLIPRFGIRGASAAWAASLVLLAVLRFVQIRAYITRVPPLNRGALFGFLAGAVSLGVGFALRLVVHGIPGALVGAAVMGVAYVGVLIALGLPLDDRQLLGELRGRARRRDEPVGA
jgi:O-antigen/teichoic acid export membrane protein